MNGASHRHSRKASNPSDPLFQEDGPLVGTPAILSSPNVIEPDINIHGLKNKPIPTPSIYTDARGQIFNLLVGPGQADSTMAPAGSETKEDADRKPGKRINILRTNKGAMRSGDLHPNTQCSFVFEGSVEVWIPEQDGSTHKFTLGPRDYFEIPAYVPHVENFKEDTVHAEWWEANDVTGTEGFQHWFYAPYRRMVDASFDWGHGRRGTLKILKEAKLIEDRDEEEGGTERSERSTKQPNCRWTVVLAGMLMGTIGFALGRLQSRR